jgi:YfiH family protein
MSDPKTVIHSGLLASVGIPHGFYTRSLGVEPRQLDRMAAAWDSSEIQDSQREAVKIVLNDLKARTLSLPLQVHGTGIWLPEGKTKSPLVRGPEADAAVSTGGGMAVGVITADCLPILVASRDGRIVAAVHGGWRSLYDSILQGSIQKICEVADKKPGELLGVIGPSIASCCYEVGDELVEKFRNRFEEFTGLVRRDGEKKFLSLQSLARQQMIQSGLDEGGIEDLGACTGCRKESFFSYRKEKGTRFRQISAILPKTE